MQEHQKPSQEQLASSSAKTQNSLNLNQITDRSEKSTKAAQLQKIANTYFGKNQPIQLATTELTLNDETSTVAISKSVELDPTDPPEYGESSNEDSDLDDIMETLPTDPRLTAKKKFVKGHLNNDNFGGEANKNNLYPITGQANIDHKNKVEDKIWEYLQGGEGEPITYTVNVTDRSIEDKDMAMRRRGVYSEIETPKATFSCSTEGGTDFDNIDEDIVSEAQGRYD